MTTAYTSLLGLALPVTGELSGTWGDTVNNSITSLVDSAIAGTTTLSADTTLTTTTGASNQARQAILLCTGHSANITITAPAQSKIYTVINASATYTVKIRGVGPTTGITIPVSSTATVAWNGSDFVDASGYINGNLKVNGTLSVTGAVTFTAGTASTTTGTGTLVITGGLGVSGRINAANFDGIVGANTAAAGSFTTLSASSTVTLSGGTANGVAYLNGSKVLTTGSALTFSGSALAVTGSISSTGGFTSNTTITAQLDGSDSAGAGPGWNLFNTAFSRGWRTQLSASNNKVDYYFNGSAYVQMTTLNTNGALALSGASTSANGVGITFPATQNASSDANTLDDYEEGTWTLTLTGSGSITVGGSSTSRYTKIGNIVTVTSGFDWSGSTLTGTINIGGLPFAISNVTGSYRSAAIFGYTSGVVFTGQLASDGAAGATSFSWIYLRSGTTPADVVLSSSGAGQICFTYQVA